MTEQKPSDINDLTDVEEIEAFISWAGSRLEDAIEELKEGAVPWRVNLHRG